MNEDSQKKSTISKNQAVNVTSNDVSATKIDDEDFDSGSKNKKILKYSVIGGGILLIIVLVVVLCVTLIDKSVDRPLPPDPPTPPPLPALMSPFAQQEYNPFSTSTVQQNDWTVMTLLKQSPTQLQSSLHLQDPFDGRIYKPIDPKTIATGANNQLAANVQLSFAMIDNYQVALNVTDPSKTYPNMPDQAFSRPVLSHEARFTQVGFVQEQSTNSPYHFNLSNIYNSETLISTYKRKLYVSDKFSEIGFILPNARIFGLGQHNSQFQLQNGTYTLWARGRDQSLPNDNAEGGLNGPHIHPFILGQTNNKDFFGIFFASPAAQSFEVVKFSGSSNIVLNYIQVGGPMEIYFIVRGSAQEILTKYHAMIGNSYVPPYYALGFFQGSSSYTTLAQVQAVMQNYAGSNMALEGVLIDNYNAGPNQVFTVGTGYSTGLSTFETQLQASNQHVILGIQSGIASGYTYYTKLITSTAYIKSALNAGQPLMGQQQTTVAYPDFLNYANYYPYQQTSLEDLDKAFQFSGLLLQNNQPYSSVSGEVIVKQQMEEAAKRNLAEGDTGNWAGSYLLNADQSFISTYSVPFVPGYANSGNLDTSTISQNATHMSNNAEVQELAMHNINGHMQLITSFNALVNSKKWSETGKRPIIFSDSTWAGSGHYGAVALTNMWRDWSSLRNSIAMAMSFSMYGVSNVASDVCGNAGPIDEELCGRWAQLSAFLPLVRNYYSAQYFDPTTQAFVNNIPTEFYTYTNYDNEFMASSALNQRLPLTRYIYSQLYKVYLKGGAMVYPLFFDYPSDDNCFADIEHTYMLGDSLKVSPVLSAGVKTTYNAYFPAGKWADMNDFSNILTSTGGYIALNQSYAYTNVHLKEGKIVPYQHNPSHFKQTRDLLTKANMSFVIHRDASNYAEGFVLADDGESASSWTNVDFAFWKLRYADKSVNFWVDWGDFNYDSQGLSIDTLGSIHIVNAEDLGGTNFACYIGQDLNPMSLAYEYNPYNKVLTIKPEFGDTVRFKDIGTIKFGNSFQEVNFCDASTAFTYKIDNIDILHSTNQMIVMTASSLQGNKLLPELVVSVALMDDSGTISLNITTQEDYNNNGQTIFKPPYVASNANFPSDSVTKRLDSYFSFTSNPFSYQIFLENTPGAVVYQSDPHKLFFDKYMLFDSGIFSLNSLNANPLMGMGERAGSLFYTEDGIHSRYTFDQANPIDDGTPPGRNMYGFQPMYVYQSNYLRWVGVFDLNAYATDYLLQFNEGVNTQITKVSIGGTIQKYFFIGSKPDDIIVKYEKLTGMPQVPPLWTFGWQQCRFGWTTDQQWIDVVYSYADNNLPLDTMWADIDYMDDYKIFTIADRYSNLATYVNQLHQKGMTFVPIMDVGVAVRPNEGYVAYDNAINQDVFIKKSDGSAPLTAGVWCGNAYFPDFFHKDIDTYWHGMFDYLTDQYGLTFDGIWIDMNEATNFCNGYCIPSERPVDSLRNKPFYVPGWRDLEDKALGVDGLHPKAWNGQDLHEYDVHNMYSLMQVQSTSSYLLKIGLRPYVLSRSNFPGIQKYGHHWMGDNWSTVEYMKLSVDGIYSYNLFGLPFMGSDICGFDGDAVGQQGSYLCARWHQLGSLYPFARNHNQNDSTSQEPYVFNTTYYATQPSLVSYTDIMRTALRNRYAFIRYYYSRFYQMQYFGGSFFKPLFFEFPNDPKAYQNIEINIMLGDALKASIQVTTIDETDATNFPQTSYYFPQGTWCQVLPQLTDKSQCITSGLQGSTVKLDSTLPNYQIHLRNGYIIPTQDSFTTKVNTTKDLELVYTDFWALPNSANSELVDPTGTYTAAALGHAYFDDGITILLPNSFNLYLVLNAANSATLNIKLFVNGQKAGNKKQEYIGKIYIMAATQAQLNGVTTATATLNDSTQIPLTAAYDAKTDILTVTVSSLAGTNESIFSVAKIDLA